MITLADKAHKIAQKAHLGQVDKAGVDYRLLVLPDHPTPICIRTHSNEPVPYLLYDSTKKVNSKYKYNEREAKESGIYEACGHEIIDRLLQNK